MKNAVKLYENIYLIDGHDLGVPGRTGTYVLTEQDLTIIETSASPSVPYIKEGIKELGFSLEDIKYIIVTHIHLDHSGGAGLLMKDCPNAKIVVHPKGKRHLADPSRLIASARMVYGDRFDKLFDPIVPIPEEKILTMENEDTLQIGNEITLTFYDTPGHANHHFSIYHPKANGMFTGDTAGITYPQLLQSGIELYLPSTSPNQFDPDKTLKSLELYKSLNLDRIFFGHFGMTENVEEVYKQMANWVDLFVKTAEEADDEGGSFEDKVNRTKSRLLEKVRAFLEPLGAANDHPAYEIIKMDLEVSSQGLIDYLSKREKTGAK